MEAAVKSGNGIKGNGGTVREERLQIMLTPEELEAVDTFRFQQRMPSRAAAVRELFRLGLSAVGANIGGQGVKSSAYGVLDPKRGKTLKAYDAKNAQTA
jgi:hypothetical protein